jgi:WD40 repeat protein/predicted Ser/Thr protein kinase
MTAQSRDDTARRPDEPPDATVRDLTPDALSWVAAPTRPAVPGPAADPAAAWVPGYEMLGLLGKGGMGVVYKARQTALGRVVALKMILAGGQAGDHERERFLSEARAAARLQHPNIVGVFDVGEHCGQPYCALEFIDGGTLRDRLAGRPQPPGAAAGLVETLAGAVEAAHRAGVVHRDLKPCNVLLTADGLPKITDFGVAKVLDEAGRTRSGDVLGTPSYMAPEQAAGKAREVGPAADVWALGAILYECLTGRPPFLADTAVETMRQVLESDPVPPRQLQSAVPAELDVICLKCLEKEQARRYASAAALAEDLCAFREGRPIRARPVTAWGRARKWVRRRPAVAILTALVAAVFAAGLAGFVWQYQKTADALEEVQGHLYVSNIVLAQTRLGAGEYDLAEAALRQCPPADEPDSRRPWEWRYLLRQWRPDAVTLSGHEGTVTDVDYSPAGDLVATASLDGSVRLWDARTGEQTRMLAGHGTWVRAVCFIDGGRVLVSAGEDLCVRRWNVADGTPLGEPIAGAGSLLAGSRTAARFAVGSWGGKVTVHDGRTGRPLGQPRQLADMPHTVALSPDGRIVATSLQPRQLVAWEVDTGRAVALDLPAEFRERREVLTLAFSPDGRHLAGGCGLVLQLWDVTTGKLETFDPGVFDEPCTGLAFQPGGNLLAAAFEGGTVRVWDWVRGGAARSPKAHAGKVEAVAFSPDGKTLAVPRGREVTLERLYGEARPPCRTLTAAGDKNLWALAVSPDFRYVAVRAGAAANAEKAQVQVWDRQAGGPPKTWMTAEAVGYRAGFLFLREDNLISGSSAARLNAWDPATGAGRDWPVIRTGEHDNPAADTQGAAASPDGRYVASLTGPCEIKLWDTTRAGSGGPAWSCKVNGHAVNCLAVDRGGRVAAAGTAGLVRLWPAGGGGPRDVAGPRTMATAVAFSPDGSRLAAAYEDGAVRVWDAASGQELFTLKGHAGRVYALAWSPDGRRLATGGIDRLVRLWETRCGKEVLRLGGHAGDVTGVAFSPDGDWLLSCARDGKVRMWDGRPADR